MKKIIILVICFTIISLVSAQINAQQSGQNQDGSKKYSFRRDATTEKGNRVRIIANLYVYDHFIVTYTLINHLPLNNLRGTKDESEVTQHIFMLDAKDNEVNPAEIAEQYFTTETKWAADKYDLKTVEDVKPKVDAEVHTDVKSTGQIFKDASINAKEDVKAEDKPKTSDQVKNQDNIKTVSQIKPVGEDKAKVQDEIKVQEQIKAESEEKSQSEVKPETKVESEVKTENSTNSKDEINNSGNESAAKALEELKINVEIEIHELNDASTLAEGKAEVNGGV